MYFRTKGDRLEVEVKVNPDENRLMGGSVVWPGKSCRHSS